ncbi:hypothetical protein EDD90_2761 [Streptomyces sp. Ag109_O5-1]|uniref:hypothetical protein n=1 Tax=Streptomyces sp. Ag109_O5-1 TaxID=1938851 RepID=UPI000FB72BA7|nr:hypothetical protein [Streptomyces sp. Ag109_O5-1]RPE39744.1 hypothetical protein EDD90_2761 [Streptomyces sp. Ag109_O5-1]
MAQVHVTMFEDPIEVPDDEVEVLRVQGLIREAPAPATPAPAAVAAKLAKTKDGDA